MKDFLKKNWGKLLIATGLITGGVIWYRRNNRNGEKSSNFITTQNKVVQFTLTNRTQSQQQVNLFNARSIDDGTGNPLVGISPSMGAFNRSLDAEPKKVLDISVRTANNMQANTPINKVCIDASGSSSSDSWIPQISVNQFQLGMVSIQPSNLVLDGSCYLNYTVGPNTTVSLIVTYAVLARVADINQNVLIHGVGRKHKRRRRPFL